MAWAHREERKYISNMHIAEVYVPELPASPTGLYLRDDGTWQQAGGGETGIQGPTGAYGGPPGATGVQGVTGVGAQGTQGVQGVTGQYGEVGPLDHDYEYIEMKLTPPAGGAVGTTGVWYMTGSNGIGTPIEYNVIGTLGRWATSYTHKVYFNDILYFTEDLPKSTTDGYGYCRHFILGALTEYFTGMDWEVKSVWNAYNEAETGLGWLTYQTAALEGARGYQGETGIGYIGADGATGPSGGDQGVTGLQGTQGIQGVTGLQGAVGAAGGTTGSVQVLLNASPGYLYTGIQCDIVIPYGLTIDTWTLLGDTAASYTIGLWKDTYGNFPPTVADSMSSGGTGPFLSAAAKNTGTTSGWTGAACAYGDVVRVNIDTSDTWLKRATLALGYHKT